MAWKIEFDSDAEKDLKKLDPHARKTVLSYLRERVATCDNPRDFGKPLQGDKSGLWRYRVNDYRIICQIHDTEVLVVVVRVGHRKHVYD